jgi:hypothetical protein
MTRSLSQSLAGGSAVMWALDWLERAGFAPTPANVQAVYSWEFAESGAGGGMWNPLNTTQGGYAGESNANSVGVKNFARRDDGLDANARVIHNGFYPLVVAAFTRGNDASAIVRAITSSPWGTRAIALRPVLGTPGRVPQALLQVDPPKEEPVAVRLFHAPNPPDPNRFCGAVVDVQARSIDVVGARLEPAEHPANPHPWWGVEEWREGGAGAFVVTAADTAEYHYKVIPL